VSVLIPGDERWHYSDGSHRWGCPDPDIGQDVWAAQVRTHVERHSEDRDTPARMMTPLGPGNTSDRYAPGQHGNALSARRAAGTGR
jgi:hypothetical protein